ncbi:MAG: TAXI family TRAP transporter solute-binding subunit [Deltaproteobacteria bacterium]|nr:TAXI family TRAP transporter solute-binding subunit [Deltaproteobacteria bacterium]
MVTQWTKRLLALFLITPCLLILSMPVIATAASISEFTLAGGSVGGSWYPIASAITELLNKELKSNIASAKPGGGVSNPILVSTGKMSAGFSYSSFLVVATKSEDPYEGKPKMTNLRAISMLFPMYWQIICDAKLPYNYIGEYIKNKYPVKLCPTKPGHGDYWVTEKAFDSMGAKLGDFNQWGGKVDLGGLNELSSLYKDRHIDMAFTHNVVPLAAFSDMAVSRESKLLNVDDSILAYLNKEYNMKIGYIPANSYKGMKEPVKTAGMSAVLFVRDDIPDDVIYALTKAIVENKKYLTSVNKLFEDYDPATAWKDVGAPLHPGAAKYFKEKGYMK